MRLLYVENHDVFARVVTGEFLSGHEVELAGSLAEARRAYLALEPFDAILVDYDLGDGKGDTLVRWLRAEGYRGLIVAVSARQRGNQALLDAGADAACPKVVFEEIGEVLAA